jgi:hypothetical protein
MRDTVEEVGLWQGPKMGVVTWASADFFPGGGGKIFPGEARTYFLPKNNKKTYYFSPKSLKTYYFWPALAPLAPLRTPMGGYQDG